MISPEAAIYAAKIILPVVFALAIGLDTRWCWPNDGVSVPPEYLVPIYAEKEPTNG